MTTKKGIGLFFKQLKTVGQFITENRVNTPDIFWKAGAGLWTISEYLSMLNTFKGSKKAKTFSPKTKKHPQKQINRFRVVS